MRNNKLLLGALILTVVSQIISGSWWQATDGKGKPYYGGIIGYPIPNNTRVRGTDYQLCVVNDPCGNRMTGNGRVSQSQYESLAQQMVVVWQEDQLGDYFDMVDDNKGVLWLTFSRNGTNEKITAQVSLSNYDGLEQSQAKVLSGFRKFLRQQNSPEPSLVRQ